MFSHLKVLASIIKYKYISQKKDHNQKIKRFHLMKKIL